MKNIFLLLLFSISAFLNAQNYIPDVSFGGIGSVVTNYNKYYDNDQAPRNVFFENNKYIFTQKTQLSCFNYDGTVDYNFGTLGYSRIIIPNCSDCPIIIKSSKIINNNIFVFGKMQDSNSILLYGFIAKMSIDGILDTTFGNNGIVTINIGNLYSNDPFSDGITDIVYKNDNYFAIGSIVYTDNVIRRNLFAVKMNFNGIVNLDFDSSGLKKFTSIDGNSAEKIYDYNDGLLIIGNISNNNTTSEHSVTFIQIDEYGSLNSTFGNNGLKKIVLIDGLCACGSSFKECNLINNDLYYNLTFGSMSGGYDKIQKIDISTLETINTLNSLSIVDFATINSSDVTKYLVEVDKIYILDCINNCQPDFNITRRNLDGTLDTTFNQTGTYSYSFPQPNSFTTTYDSASVLIKDNNDRILIGGYTSAQLYTTAPYRGFAMLRIKDETFSNNEFRNNDFTLSPNPVRSILNIENSNDIIIDTITIFNVLGKIVYFSDKPLQKINLETLNEGFYFVKINSGNRNGSFKIIKSN